MDFVQLQYFQVLAETQHMTSAANMLHVAQPALSRTLRNLEKELGLLLFDRQGKSIRLNDNGEILLRHARVILQELEDIRSELTDRREQEAQQVSIVMHAATKLLPELIRGFKDRYPDISLRITQQDREPGADLTGKCDIAIYTSSAPAEGPGTVTLMKEDICLAMPVSNPLSTRKSVLLSEVAAEPFIGLYRGQGLRTITDEYCRAAGFEPRVVLESDSPGTVRELIALGVGLSFIPRITWSGIDRDPNVSLVEIREPHCIRYVNMAWRENRYVSGASRLLQQYLIEYFSDVARKETQTADGTHGQDLDF